MSGLPTVSKLYSRPAFRLAYIVFVLVFFVVTGWSAGAQAAPHQGTSLRVDSLVPTCTKTVEKAYDWTVSKSVDLPSFSLTPGQSKTVTYTVSATRDQGTVTNTSCTVGATLTLSNTGEYITQGLTIRFYVEYKSPHSNQWGTVPGSIYDLPSPGEIEAGAAREFSYGPVAFTPVEGASTYRMVAYVTHAIHGGTGTGQEITHRADMSLSSTATTAIETDASANLTDLLGTVPSGSEFGYDGSSGPWQMTGSGSFTYKATIKNNALAAPATFLNTIRLVEGDSGQVRTSQATVLVGVATAGISAYDPASIAIDRSVTYNWGLDKSVVGPSTVTIPAGQTKPVDYTITISRAPIYTETAGRMASAGVTVTNSGSDPVTVSRVTVKVQYRFPVGSGAWADVVPIAKWEVTPGNVITSGGSHLYGPYEIVFTPVTGAEYRTHVEAATSGGAITTYDHTVSVTYTDVPVNISQVLLTDAFSDLTALTSQGLEFQGAGPTNWTNPSPYVGNQCTVTLHVLVTNRSAAQGGSFSLNNKATLVVSYSIGPEVKVDDTASAVIKTTGQSQGGGGTGSGGSQGQPDNPGPSGSSEPHEPHDPPEPTTQPPSQPGGNSPSQTGSNPPAGATSQSPAQPPLLAVTAPGEPPVGQPRQRPLPYTGGDPVVFVAIGALLMGMGIILKRR